MEELLAKYFTGEISSEEAEEVEAWRAASEENAQTFLEYKTTWLMTHSEPATNQRLLASILEDNNEQKVEIIPLWKQKAFQLAASIIVILGVVFLIIQLNKDDQPYGQVVADITDFTLPDGSKVTLQRGASITIGDFENVREVNLTGKAYFDVERDESMPFVVNTPSVKVSVLGTSFVVNSLDEDGSAEVMVESGDVSMAQRQERFGVSAMEIRLSKGEMGVIRVNERGIKKKKIRDDNFLSWKSKVITFKRDQLSDVAVTLEDVYGISFEFENQSLRNCLLTAQFNQKTPEEIANIIAETYNFTYLKQDHRFLFSGEGCH